jgi:hypothetical protein
VLVNFYRVKKQTGNIDGTPITEWRYSSGTGKRFIKVTVARGSGVATVERFLSKTERVDGTTVPLPELLVKLDDIDRTWGA